MEPSPRPALDLSTPLYFQLVYTLTDLLPPPLDDTPEGLHVRNQAAIAKVAALLPVGANEAELAAQCIAARAQAEEMLRLVRQHAGDIGLVIRLNAQYGSMVRTSLSIHGRLMRVQALRQKRDAIEGAAAQDAWTAHIAERTMLQVADPQAARPQPVQTQTAPAVAPADPPMEQRMDVSVPKDGAKSQDVAFETDMSAHPGNRQARAPAKTDLRKGVVKALAGSLLARSLGAGQVLPASGSESPGSAA